jgi:hypothetical protein
MARKMARRTVVIGASSLPLIAMGRHFVFAADPIKIGLPEDMSGKRAAPGLPSPHGAQRETGDVTPFGGITGRPDRSGPQGDTTRSQQFAAPCENSTRSSC